MKQSSNVAHLRLVETPSVKPERQDLNRLAALLDRFAPHDGQFPLTPSGIKVLKTSSVSAEETCVLSDPGVCIVAQGAKATFLSSHAFEYDENNLIVYAAEVPIRYRIIKASQDEPYLCLAMPIEPQKLSELIVKAFPHGVPKCNGTNPIYIGESDAKIVKAAIRLMDLIQKQEEIDLLVPLVIEEIFIRLLRSPVGAAIAQIGIADSHSQKISKAIAWLKKHFADPIKMESLSAIAGMSISSFHTHFKAITTMTPLQFQKTLRLQEARNLMMSRHMDISLASLEVGYTSSSQFSREYRRYFGVSPSEDMQKNN